MITGELLELVYEAASIQRWNDHMRPAQGFTELDKQAQKMVYAYILAKFEETEGTINFDWTKLIEGGLFEFLHRIKLTDIKPPVFHRMMEQKGNEINEWVLNEYEALFDGIDSKMHMRFKDYLFDSDYARNEKEILNASHYLATNWEFRHIYRLNQGLYGLDEERESIERRLSQHRSLVGVINLAFDVPIQHFVDLVGQLRFQQRWAQSPRIPQTSVLGHMLVVAIIAYFASLDLNACPKRIYNNYFCGLFHDLPEVLTRDIVAPVKRSVPDLDVIIKDIESSWVEERIYPLLPPEWHQEFRYFLEDEFTNRVMIDGERVNTSITPHYNQDKYNPLDGEIVKACDRLAAFTEAAISIRHGVKSKHLYDGLSIYSDYQGDKGIISGVDFGPIFRSMGTVLPLP
ncbi:MAG TPA: HD domain-containing protein [Bacillota bacterium]|nr:HD domain-containing protein [Candidatus Fermentithermobacillaceae bacterium]HOK65025.1 HD domain-containing protein [Bacillota bacterium]HOL11819.1 HD domain-containing protein [Bacillota bacterium]HPP61461.1 HD domain-containing protein [Bacillota bacterium]HPZ78211.1 HD domain-containing protein [Bacillota bacterium]